MAHTTTAAVKNPYHQYQSTQIQTAGPAQLTLMCYDGISRFLGQAREAMLARRYDVQSLLIGRTQALLTELRSGLDFAGGGAAIARELDALYRYLYERLTRATIHDDVNALDEVRAHVATLRGAWAEAMNLAQQPSAAASSDSSEAGNVPPPPSSLRDLALSA